MKMIQQTDLVQIIHCPNCGSRAEREHISERNVVQTECPSCDYFMVIHAETAQVVEAYAPGLPAMFR